MAAGYVLELSSRVRGTLILKESSTRRATFTVISSSLISFEMSSLIVSSSFSTGISFGSATAHATVISVKTITNVISGFLRIVFCYKIINIDFVLYKYNLKWF